MMENQNSNISVKSEQASDVQTSREEEILRALRRGANLDALRIFHTEEITPARCEAAAKGFSLMRILKSLHTEELCLIFIRENAKNILYVSKKLLTPEFSLKAACVNGLILEYIEEKLITKEVAVAAVRSNGVSIKFVPEKLRNKELYEMSIKSNGNALEFYPADYKTERTCWDAVSNKGTSLEFVPEMLKTRELCSAAVINDGVALKFVPEEFVDSELCECAVSSNSKSIAYIPGALLSVKIVTKALNDYKCATDYIPVRWFSEKRLRAVAYEQGVMRVESKGFDTDKKCLYVIEEIDYAWMCTSFRQEYYYSNGKHLLRSEFKTFVDFCKYLGNDLTGADLRDYHFRDADLSNCIIDDAYIPVKVLLSQGLDGYGIYDKIKTLPSRKSVASKDEIVIAESILHLSDVESTRTDPNYEIPKKYYYISDIHLEWKLKKYFRKPTTDTEIRRYLKKKIEGMINIQEVSRGDLLILGDTAEIFELSKMFYEELSRQWNRGKIIVVLGNHELRGTGLNANSVDEVIEEYRKMLKKLGINLLQNYLVVDDTAITEEVLLKSDIEKLRAFCMKGRSIIFGGTGYAGYCSDFSADNGLYLNKLNATEELERTKHFEKLYLKVKEAIGRRQIVVATHMPKQNWSQDQFCEKWIYVNGHTHKNECYESPKFTLYADNQVGYKRQSLGLKSFVVSPKHDIFTYYEDGIHKVSLEDFINFHRGIGINVNSYRNDGEILLLKNAGFYMFIYKRSPDGLSLYIMNGGGIKKLEKYDLDYYFEKMKVYGENAKKMLSGYNDALENISKAIKSIGGCGTIHGCIVDIDFFSHVYLNPFDGSITPYYATNMRDKWVFADIKSLVNSKCPLLASRLELCDHKTLPVFELQTIGDNENTEEDGLYVSSTCMYAPSRIIRRLQYTTKSNLIRIWDEEILDALAAAGEGKLIEE